MIPAETIGSSLGEVAATLADAGFDEPRRRARRLVAAALGLSAAEIFAYPDRMVAVADGDRIAALLARIVAREPLSRILGTREFWGLEFSLSADAFDPRPETETVVEAVLALMSDRNRPYRLLDLGTGSGCLLLALLSELPAATGIGVDIAPGAVASARANAAALGLAGRARFAVGDWGGAVGGNFDVIVANPPYVATAAIAALPREVKDYDPLRALDGGADGIEPYRIIAADLPRLLCPGGIFAAEIGAGQHAEVAAILEARGLAIEVVAADLAGIARCVVARWR